MKGKSVARELARKTWMQTLKFTTYSQQACECGPNKNFKTRHCESRGQQQKQKKGRRKMTEDLKLTLNILRFKRRAKT